jgi:hypothetical protein
MLLHLKYVLQSKYVPVIMGMRKQQLMIRDEVNIFHFLALSAASCELPYCSQFRERYSFRNSFKCINCWIGIKEISNFPLERVTTSVHRWRASFERHFFSHESRTP